LSSIATPFSREAVNCEAPITGLALTWILLPPLIFLLLGGVPSFETTAAANGTSGSLAGMSQSRQITILGYVIFPASAYGTICWLVIKKAPGVLALAAQQKCIVLLACFTIASSIWSQDPIRSAYNGIFYLIGTLFAFYLVKRFRPEQLMTLIMIVGTVVCVLDLLTVAFLPRYGYSTSVGRDAGAWRGIFIDRNFAAKCLTFLLSPALVFTGSKYMRFRPLFILLLIGSILMTKAVSAIVVLCLYTFVMIAIPRIRRRGRGGAWLWSFAIMATTVLIVILIATDERHILGLLGRDTSLTGRTEVWRALIPSILKRPFFGYGFYAFWLGMKGESSNIILATHWVFGYAHNGFLEVVLQLGVVGLSLFAATFILAIRDAWRCLADNPSTGVYWYIGVLVLTIIYNFVEETIVWPISLLSVLYVVACAGLSLEAKRIRYASLACATDQ
jgi:exopolysaccharide production protein ExoQ